MLRKLVPVRPQSGGGNKGEFYDAAAEEGVFLTKSGRENDGVIGTARIEQLAASARDFLIPHWRQWHKDWGPPDPSTLSQWTCVRSSLFLSAALSKVGVCATIESGVPETSEPVGRPFGFRKHDGWTSHAWTRCGGLIIDITADQFVGANVLLTDGADTRYRAGDDELSVLVPSDSARREVHRLLAEWRRR